MVFKKKNERFDIPAERNLCNIDLLIAKSTDGRKPRSSGSKSVF
jgi:hypothetical protein